jgi:hypothetical protein
MARKDKTKPSGAAKGRPADAGAAPSAPLETPRGKRHVYDERTAEKCRILASYGVPGDQVCVLAGISQHVLYRHYGDSYQEGLTQGNAALAHRLYQKALDGDTTCLIFLAKARLKMRTVDQVDHVSSDGSMSGGTVNVISPLAVLSPTQENIGEMREMFRRLTKGTDVGVEAPEIKRIGA